MSGDPPHGPGATWVGSQSPGSPSVSAPPSVNGTEPSPGSMSVTGRSLRARAARGCCRCRARPSSSVGVERVEQVGQAAGAERLKALKRGARSGRCRRWRRRSRSGRSRRTSRPARACRRGRRRGWARRCRSAQTASPKAPWVKSSSAATCRSSGSSGPGPQSGEPEPTAGLGERRLRGGSARPGRWRRPGGGRSRRGRGPSAPRRRRRRAARRGTGAARSATGFEASTSGSRSSSAARRLTKVVFAVAHEVGQLRRSPAASALACGRRSRSSSGSGCRPAAEMSGARSASAPESFDGVDDQVLEARAGRRSSSAKTRREVERNGFR